MFNKVVNTSMEYYDKTLQRLFHSGENTFIIAILSLSNYLSTHSPDGCDSKIVRISGMPTL